MAPPGTLMVEGVLAGSRKPLDKAPAPPNGSTSAKYGGFCHSPCPPWFQEESCKIPYPARITVLSPPIGFQASPMRGSTAVLSNWMPTRPSVVMQLVHPEIPGLPAGTYHLRL